MGRYVFRPEAPHDRPDPHPLDLDVLASKPVVRGMRFSVEFIIGLMGDGWSEANILLNYASLAREDIAACLGYSRYILKSEKPTSAPPDIRFLADGLLPETAGIPEYSVSSACQPQLK